MIRVLHYIYGLNIGGAESFIYNLINSTNVDEYIFDFCIQEEENSNKELLSLIGCRGGKIVIIPNFYKNPIKSKRKFKELLMGNQYDIIHIHVNALINVSPCEICRQLNQKFILHSHNTRSNAGMIGQIVHYINRKRYEKYEYGRLACGPEAGSWMFGKRKYSIIYNGINVGRYRYSEEKRIKVRTQYGISHETIVIGHVGRFSRAKNHQHILKVFYEYHKDVSNSVLFLVGDGEKREDIGNYIREYNLEKNVIMTGSVDNVQDYYSGFDILLFPSIYEGLPFTLIEAQASGLCILASDLITQTVKVTDLLKYESLQRDVSVWVKDLKYLNFKGDRGNYYKLIESTLFDSNKMAEKVAEKYWEVLQK